MTLEEFTSRWYSKISLYGFLLGILGVVANISLPSFLLTMKLGFGRTPTKYKLHVTVLLIYTSLVALASLVLITRNAILTQRWDNALRAFGLGVIFGLGLVLTLHTNHWAFGLYLSLLGFFHWSEYYITAVTNVRALTIDLYMLSHSREYYIAALTSWLEYWLEWLLLPNEYKQVVWLTCIGLAISLVGEGLRKGAMWTARTNFNHYVQYVHRQDHQLVQHGVYAWCRHPSYVGWFLWSVGTQILLVNPVCTIGYALVAWQFFHERIEIEEQTLLGFFGQEYQAYQTRVGTGIPFIKGYVVEFASESQPENVNESPDNH